MSRSFCLGEYWTASYMTTAQSGILTWVDTRGERTHSSLCLLRKETSSRERQGIWALTRSVRCSQGTCCHSCHAAWLQLGHSSGADWRPRPGAPSYIPRLALMCTSLHLFVATSDDLTWEVRAQARVPYDFVRVCRRVFHPGKTSAADFGLI